MARNKVGYVSTGEMCSTPGRRPLEIQQPGANGSQQQPASPASPARAPEQQQQQQAGPAAEVAPAGQQRELRPRPAALTVENWSEHPTCTLKWVNADTLYYTVPASVLADARREAAGPEIERIGSHWNVSKQFLAWTNDFTGQFVTLSSLKNTCGGAEARFGEHAIIIKGHEDAGAPTPPPQPS